uniref:Large ribosomal subunit protein bL19m n=1 Tax=Romanomermis culicivorax TaxID=13658 RepID=A0A915L064_ROMCU
DHNDKTIVNIETKNDEKPCDFTVKKHYTVPPELRLVLPDFMPEPDFSRRNLIAEKLERLDMLRRRQVLDVPEFYVGSVLAVSVSDEHAAKCSNRFVGICISRDDRGLRHHFTLRNVVDGFGEF